MSDLMLVHPDGATRTHPAEAECAVCGNDTFKCLMLDMGKAARISGIVCAICGDVTDFDMAAPEDRS